MFLKLYSVEQLTIFLPTEEIHFGKRYDIKENSKILVFWSKWGHEKYSCFAYVTRGNLELRRLRVPPEMADWPRDVIPAGDERRFETIEANLDLQFNEIVDERSARSEGRRRSDCPAFEIAGYSQFYWLPISELNWNE